MKNVPLAAIAAVLFFLFVPSVFSYPAGAFSLPEISGYTCGPLRSSPLSAPSGEFGNWLVRTYRGQGGRAFLATLISGPGAGPLVTPPGEITSNDLPVGFGSVYEAFSLGDRDAVLENIPGVGLSLAVSLGRSGSLTLESPSLGRKELEEAAIRILKGQE